MAKSKERIQQENKAYQLWKEAGGINAPKGTLKEIANKVNLPESTVRRLKMSWKKKDSERSKDKAERSKEKEDKSKHGQRYDWEKLKTEYLAGDYKSLKEFAEDKNLNYNTGAFSNNTKGWKKEKKQFEIETRNKIQDRLAEKLSEKYFELEIEFVEKFAELVRNPYKLLKNGTKSVTQTYKAKQGEREETKKEVTSYDYDVSDFVDERKLKIINDILTSRRNYKLNTEKLKIEKKEKGYHEDDVVKGVQKVSLKDRMQRLIAMKNQQGDNND